MISHKRFWKKSGPQPWKNYTFIFGFLPRLFFVFLICYFTSESDFSKEICQKCKYSRQTWQLHDFGRRPRSVTARWWGQRDSESAGQADGACDACVQRERACLAGGQLACVAGLFSDVLESRAVRVPPLWACCGGLPANTLHVRLLSGLPSRN